MWRARTRLCRSGFFGLNGGRKLQKPGTPSNEVDRLAELDRLGILDTPPEERFDRYTRLIKRLLDVPIALVSLVDEHRQWFKSHDGLEARETPREISFCGHAILSEELFVIEDAAADSRFCDNPLVQGDPNIRFYAGFPLHGPGGQAVGTLCVIDRKARSLNAEDLRSLRDIGEMVTRELASVALATTDELTGISNRRGFELLCSQVLALSQRTDRSVVMAMIDLDGFKSINDRFGHAEGDRALIEFSQCLTENFRESDVVARLAGDEFAVLMTDADEAQAAIALNRLSAHVRHMNAERALDYELNFSWGLAGFRSGVHDNVSDLLRDADALMYGNKSSNSRRLSALGALIDPLVELPVHR